MKRIGDLSSEHLSQYADVRRFNKLDNIIRNNCNVQLKMVIISSLLKQKKCYKNPTHDGCILSKRILSETNSCNHISSKIALGKT